VELALLDGVEFLSLSVYQHLILRRQFKKRRLGKWCS